MPVKLSVGLHCKACDALLSTQHHDPELCGTCLEVAYSLTGEQNDNATDYDIAPEVSTIVLATEY